MRLCGARTLTFNNSPARSNQGEYKILPDFVFRALYILFQVYNKVNKATRRQGNETLYLEALRKIFDGSG